VTFNPDVWKNTRTIRVDNRIVVEGDIGEQEYLSEQV
jgi:hypothetical protein